jgi:hypothetical protein
LLFGGSFAAGTRIKKDLRCPFQEDITKVSHQIGGDFVLTTDFG